MTGEYLAARKYYDESVHLVPAHASTSGPRMLLAKLLNKYPVLMLPSSFDKMSGIGGSYPEALSSDIEQVSIRSSKYIESNFDYMAAVKKILDIL